MKNVKFLIVFIMTVVFNITLAQNFVGKYFMQSVEGNYSLTIEKKGSGIYSGTLDGEGESLVLKGQIEEGLLRGTIGDGYDEMIFKAKLRKDVLTFTILENSDEDLNIPGAYQTLTFYRESSRSNLTNPQTAKSDEVIINDMVLSKEQIQEIVDRYGVTPKPGNYWYDKVSGLYGVVGYPSYGYMYPGHEYGELKRNVSNGNTNVIVNGRELPYTEWAVWSYIIKYWIQPGNYWFDDQGYAGYVGNPTPIINMFLAAKQNAYNGKGGSGDNFWSSRFSAGNYDSGNQRGYVSVPGYGPVGYGF